MKIGEPGGNNVHNNAFYAEETLLKSEMQAMRDCNPLTARHWIVSHSYPYLELLLPSGCRAFCFLLLICLRLFRGTLEDM